MTKQKPIETDHTHRRPTKRDFQGKTIKRFERTADNVWRFAMRASEVDKMSVMQTVNRLAKIIAEKIEIGLDPKDEADRMRSDFKRAIGILAGHTEEDDHDD